MDICLQFFENTSFGCQFLCDLERIASKWAIWIPFSHEKKDKNQKHAHRFNQFIMNILTGHTNCTGH